MIARLRGIVDAVRADSIVLDVNGVGYLVYCTTKSLLNLPPLGAPLSLHIETQVREDAITLYGFAQEIEREWFRLLITVQGVGAKVALAILGVLGAEGAARAVALQDKAAFARTPGVGPKLAARIANELKDKAPAQRTEYGGHPPSPSAMGDRWRTEDGASVLSPLSSEFSDALSALVNLGYKETETVAALARVRLELGEGASVAALIRNGLRELSA